MTQMQQFDGTEHITMYHEPERTSIAAILGLVLSCIGCCGGVTAVFGIFLSIFGIVGVSRSKGRVGGMGFAIAGLLIGILMLALWGGMFGIGVYGLKWMEKSAANTTQVLRDIEGGNYDAARAAMGSPGADMSDEMMAAFADGYLGGLGGVVSETNGVVEILTEYGIVGERIQRYNGRPGYIPMPIKFEKGTGLVVIEIDPSAANSGSAAPIRIIVIDVDGNESVLPPWDWKPSDPELPGVDIEDFSDDSGGDADDGP